jgi:serine/threonine protein kinase
MDEPISQRYQIREELGKGGFSTVYIAWDALLSREVALKVLKTSGGDHEELVQRFLTEARITSKLNHPNTLTIFDFGKSPDGRCFLVSELLKGESLFDFLLQGAVPPEFALQIIYQMGLALHEAHSQGVVHRDIKPGNIFLSTPMRGPHFVKLLDFGIAKIVQSQSQTMTGQMMGTPLYMSPEQIVNIKKVDHRTDIYSLGIVFFHLMTGTVPFHDESHYEILRQHMQRPLPPILIEGITSTQKRAIERLIKRMTHKAFNKRLQSMEEVLSGVIEILDTFSPQVLNKGEALNVRWRRDYIPSEPPDEIPPSALDELSSPLKPNDMLDLSDHAETHLDFDDPLIDISENVSLDSTLFHHIREQSKPSIQIESATLDVEIPIKLLKTQPLNEDELNVIIDELNIRDPARRSSKDLLKESPKILEMLPPKDDNSINEFEVSLRVAQNLEHSKLHQQETKKLKDAQQNIDPLEISKLKGLSSKETVDFSNDLLMRGAQEAELHLKISSGESTAAHPLTESADSALAQLKNQKIAHSGEYDQSAFDFDFDFGVSRAQEIFKPKVTKIFIYDANGFAGRLYADGLLKGVRQKDSPFVGGISIETLSESDQLQDTLKRTPCDLLIIELKANTPEALEFIKLLRALHSRPKPLIAISRGDQAWAKTAKRAGADSYLNKPFQLQALFKTVISHLAPK